MSPLYATREEVSVSRISPDASLSWRNIYYMYVGFFFFLWVFFLYIIFPFYRTKHHFLTIKELSDLVCGLTDCSICGRKKQSAYLFGCWLLFSSF